MKMHHPLTELQGSLPVIKPLEPTKLFGMSSNKAYSFSSMSSILLLSNARGAICVPR